MNHLYSGITNVFKTCFKNPILNLLLFTGLATSSYAQCPITITANGLNTSSVLCSGTSATLTSDAVSNYSWTPGNNISAAFIVSPTVTTTYTLSAMSLSNCPGTAVITVSVVLTPTVLPSVSPTLSPICFGKSATLTAAGATSYTWTNGATTVNTNTYAVTPPAGINTFTVYRSISGCTSTSQVNVIVNALPTPFAIVNPTIVCALQPATLAVAGGNTYTWTSPGNPPTSPSFSFQGASAVVFPPVSTIYTVAASDGTCVNTTTVELLTNPNPTITASANPTSVCSGGTVTINANGSTSYSIVSSSAPTVTLNTIPFTPTLTGSTSFIISGINSFNCISSYNQIVVVYPNPTVTASIVGSKTLACSGGSISLTASGATTYSWSTGALTQSTIVNPVSLVSGPVIYTVTGTTSSTTCHSSQTVAANVFIPTITVTGNTSTCFGGNIVLNASGGTGNGNYKWYTVLGAPTSTIANLSLSVTAPAIYTLTALTTSTTAQLCPSTLTVGITIFYNPTITAVAERTPICSGESVNITASGGNTYLWNIGDNTQTAVVSPTNNTTYTVTGTDINGCSSTGTVQVKVSACSGIKELNGAAIGLNVYPNPSNGEFVIKSESNLKLNLINDLGQLVRTIELSGTNNYKVSVNDLSKGIYFLSGEKDNLQIRQKIVVTK